MDTKTITVHSTGLGILKGKRHIALVAVVLMIVVLAILHGVFAHAMYKAGGFSLKNPVSYLMIAVFLVIAAFKLRFLWRFKNRIGKHFKK
jgi:hypothetical protein